MPARARFALGLVAALLALAYLLPFRAYGLTLEDEGTLLFQILRVVRGDLPYLDFVTGYTPGFFYLAAGLWTLAGNVVSLRMVLACVHALTIAGLSMMMARGVRPALAVLLPLLYLAFIPVYPGEFCAFNVPYPAWFANLGWIVTATAVLAFVRGRRRRSWLVVAGVAAAATFAMKPNAGVFAVAAAIASLLGARPSSGERERGGPLSGAIWLVLWAGILAGAWVTIGLRPNPVDAFVYLVPLGLAFLALLARVRIGRRALVGDVTALLLPFVVVTVPWLGFFLVRLGPDRFLHDVLLVGSNAAALYYEPYPALQPWGLLALALALAAGAAGALVRMRRLRPATALALALVGGLGSATAAVTLGLMPERLLWSIIWQLESAGFGFTIAAHLAGVVWLWRRRAAADETLLVVLLFALFMHMQLYPRADFTHLVGAVPLTIVLAGLLLERVLRWWEEGLARPTAARTPRIVGGAAAALVVAVIGLRLAPNVVSLATEPRFLLPFPVAPVGVEAERADDLRALAASATHLARLVGPGAPSLGFPALDVVLFLAGAVSPTPQTYFFPGRPDHREEAEVVDALEAARPGALASANHRFVFFDAAPAYYFLLRQFVRDHYVLAGRYGRFDVLADVTRSPLAAPDAGAARSGGRGVDRGHEDTGSADTAHAALARLAEAPLAESAAGLLDAATSDDPSTRRVALTLLLDALERASADGLELYVARAGLDRRRQVLLLRAIRDEREIRAASYLFAAAASSDPRITAEALGAMDVTRAELIARRHLWAGPAPEAPLPGASAVADSVRATLADRRAPERASALAAALAARVADPATVPDLRAIVTAGADAASVAAAAATLAELAPDGLGCTLTALLARADLEIVELVPSSLLRLLTGAEPARSETRRCLEAAIATAGPVAAQAIWVAAAFGDGALAPALADALASADAETRRAAAWALGELPDDPAAAAVLARVAASDADPVVRRLAGDAAAKQSGRLRRSLHPIGLSANAETR